MPHGGGGGSHGGGSHSSHSSSHSSSHRSGGGSHGGGSHSSSHHSYGGGGYHGGGGYEPRPHYRRRSSYFPGSYKYVYYRHHRPYYYYSDSPKAEFTPASHIVWTIVKSLVSVYFLFPLLITCLTLIFSAASPQTRISASYDDTIVIEDDAGIFEDTKELETAMDTFLDETGIAPAVITVNNEDWEDYYDSLELYAYDLYVNYFSDEYHFLIVYSEPETVDSAFNDWYWEYMAGDDTDEILTYSVCDEFTESLQSKLLANSRYTVDKAIAEALTETSGTCMENSVGSGMVIGAVIGVVVILCIFWLMFFGGKAKRKAMKEAKKIPTESEHLEIKCEYCGGIYLKGTCTECPHCGAPIKL